MPVITRPQAIAISRGVYVDRQYPTNSQRFTPIPLATLLSASGIDFTNNQIPLVGDPGNQVFTLNPISSVASVLTLIDKPHSSQTKVDALATNFILGAPGFIDSTNNTLANAAGNIKKFADRVKNGYCNLSILGDSLIKPSNSHLFQALYKAWNPINWRGVVTTADEMSVNENIGRLIGAHGQSSFTWGALGGYYPPSAPLPLYTTNVTITNANTVSTNPLTLRVLDQGTTIIKFTSINTFNFNGLSTDSGRTQYLAQATASIYNIGLNTLFAGYIKESQIQTYFGSTPGRYLHGPNTPTTINSFTRRVSSPELPATNAIKCSMSIIKPRQIETMPAFKIAIHNGARSSTDTNGTFDTIFVPYDFHQGNYGSNALVKTIDLTPFPEYSINIIELGSVNEKPIGEISGNLFTWRIFVEGNNNPITLSNTDDTNRPKIFCIPKFRFYNTKMTTGLQIGVDGNSGFKAKQVAGLDSPQSTFFTVTNVTVGGTGNIDLYALAKRFEFEGTNTIMIELGTNDAGDTADNIFLWLKALYNKVTEAWNIAKLNNPECSNNGELLINFLLPYTTGTGTAAANNTVLTALTNLMKTFVAENPNCSYISLNEILNRSFITSGVFTTTSGYSITASQGWDLDTTGTTNYFFAEDASNVHPPGITGNWSAGDTKPSFLLLQGVWTILDQASSNLNYTVHGYLEPLGRNGGSLTSETTTVSNTTYQRVTDRDYNYHITGLGILKKIK